MISLAIHLVIGVLAVSVITWATHGIPDTRFGALIAAVTALLLMSTHGGVEWN